MKENNISVYGLGGDTLTAPEHTETAFWTAMGGGAQGIVSGIRLSRDKVVVCTAYDSLEEISGDSGKISEMEWSSIQRQDAGAVFRSSDLDNEDQPTDAKGLDNPWEGGIPQKRAISLMKLEDLLILFPRRTKVFLALPEGDQELMEIAVTGLKKYGVLDRVTLIGSPADCRYLNKTYPGCSLALIGASIEHFQEAKQIATDAFYMDWNIACTSRNGYIELLPKLKNELENTTSIELLLGSDSMFFSPTQDYVNALKGCNAKIGIISRGVLPTVEKIAPEALIFSDDFAGTRIDRSMWSAGYSHINQDTVISQNNGLHIEIKEDGTYSGAAGICLIPIYGRFDAQVDFEVSNPKQGTTFELAAICIDPGYHHMENDDLNTRNVNLTFDVHGAPPYASSERDEDDGFRCGWNNGFNLTRVETDWEASSVNMYNKYGRDVGNGDSDNPTGSLRLIRNGSVFVSYYKDKYNNAWVCSGAMLIQNMSDNVYIRLAAKHWNKRGNPAPSNHITFHNFKLFQF